MTTPMMAQWEACKEQAKDALLLFRLGDFYEAFYQDAQTISKAIGLTLTARQGTPMCGVPYHTSELYIDKLIAKGFKIAIAEQTEDPKEVKGLVKREIVRTVTPGTIVNSQLLSDKKNNFIASVIQLNAFYGLSVLDVTTGELRVHEFEEPQEVLDELYRLRPVEFIIQKGKTDLLKELSHSFPFVVTEKEKVDPAAAAEIASPYRIEGKMAAVLAAGSLLIHLKELGIPLDHIALTRSESFSQSMSLDRSTFRNLELTESMEGENSKHTLLGLLDETVTAMGGRLLRNWIRHPLLSCPEIEKRQEIVASFLEKRQEARSLRSSLELVRDLERLIMKISARFATPRDLLGLGISLAQIPKIKEALLPFTLLEPPHTFPIGEKIVNSLNESAPLRIGEGEIFKDGYHPELDRLRQMGKESMSWIARYQAALREQTGIKNLKVGFTRAFGYYIEVSRSHTEKIPETFQRRQTLVNGERFITNELKQFESQVLTAEERAKALETELFEQLRSETAKYAASINQAAKGIAQIDVLLSLAKVADDQRFTRPKVDDSDVLEIVEGRHPIIEKAIGHASFIPNDTKLDPNQQLMLITGPNMAGKSTYIRQVALIAILAQIGSYVPAKSARIGLVDKVFSRIGASDDLARGQSTFMVEMTETANILNNATSRSLVLLDEIGRGTSTYDGISIAWAVAEYLLTALRAKTLFATHYWELTRLEKEFSHAANYQIAVQEIPGGIVFLRKIIKGGTDKSYGIHVAKLAGLPYPVIKRAEEMLSELEAKRAKRKKWEEQLSFDGI